MRSAVETLEVSEADMDGATGGPLLLTDEHQTDNRAWGL